MTLFINLVPHLSLRTLEHLQQSLYLYFWQIKCYCSHSNWFSKHTDSPIFFWSCYSTSINLENTIATPNQFFCLKNYPNYYYINSFSLLQISFFFSLILSVSHIIQTQNTKQNLILKIKLNQNKQIWKKKMNKPIWPRFSHNPNTKHKTKSNS